MPMDDPSLGGIDIDAISDTVRALPDDVRVMDITHVERDADTNRVTWTMTLETDARSTSVADFLTPDDDTDTDTDSGATDG